MLLIEIVNTPEMKNSREFLREFRSFEGNSNGINVKLHALQYEPNMMELQLSGIPMN